jgi:hypothetical protein
MSSESTINVFIKDEAGITTEIVVSENGTVHTLKEKYSELHTDITVEEQKLVIDSQNVRIALEDHNTISSYNFAANGLGSRENPILIFTFKSK